MHPLVFVKEDISRQHYRIVRSRAMASHVDHPALQPQEGIVCKILSYQIVKVNRRNYSNSPQNDL